MNSCADFEFRVTHRRGALMMKIALETNSSSGHDHAFPRPSAVFPMPFPDGFTDVSLPSGTAALSLPCLITLLQRGTIGPCRLSHCSRWCDTAFALRFYCLLWRRHCRCLPPHRGRIYYLRLVVFPPSRLRHSLCLPTALAAETPPSPCGLPGHRQRRPSRQRLSPAVRQVGDCADELEPSRG